MADDERWWWCLTHGTTERGQGCRAQDRLGSYPSEQAARDWKATHTGREEAWEEEDERWEGEKG